ncbi:UNVERIFIED_CONTAM: hypothetical protein HDU68_008947 [Siphonaria sp. JEL0065]|nr:hypothetical protein HDU68_008947 [Siphonaria sp. JEL0065]
MLAHASVTIRVANTANSLPKPHVRTLASTGAATTTPTLTVALLDNTPAQNTKKSLVFDTTRHATTSPAAAKENEEENHDSVDLQALAAAAVAGKHRALFVASAAKAQRATSVFDRVFDHLVNLSPTFNASVSWVYFGVTDTRLINLVTERNIAAAFINSDVTPLLSPLQSKEEILNLLKRESSIPTMLYFRVESMKPERTIGTLCLVDLAYLGGNGHSTFVLTLDATDKYSVSENEHAIEMLHSFKKIKSCQTVHRVDPRVTSLEKKVSDFTKDLERLTEANALQNTALTSNSSRIQDLESLIEQTRQDAARRISEAEQRRKVEVAALKKEYAGVVAAANVEAEGLLMQFRDSFEKEKEKLVEGFAKEKDGLVAVAEMERKEAVKAFEKEKKRLVSATEAERKLACKKLDQEKEEYSRRTTLLENKLVTQEFTFNTSIVDLNVQLECERKIVALLQTEMKEKNGRIESLVDRIAESNAEVSILTERLAHRVTELHETQGIIANLHSQIKSLRETIASLRDSLETSKRETAAVQQDSQATHTTLTATQQTLATTQTQVTSLQHEIETLQDQVAHLNTKLTDRKQVYKENLAAAEAHHQDLLKRTVSELEDDLSSKHNAELESLMEKHQIQLRQLRKEFTKTGMDKTSEAQTRVDEIESQLEEMKRSHTRELDRIQRKAKTEVEGDLKDLEAKVEESEEIGKAWKKDAERLQKALFRAIDMGKVSLQDFEKEVDVERDLWETERRTLKNKVQTLETRLVSISETLKAANQSQKNLLPDDVHKSIMVATVVQPKEPEKPQLPRKRARMSDISDLLEISAKVGKSIPTKRAAKAPASRRYETKKFESDDEEVVAQEDAVDIVLPSADSDSDGNEEVSIHKTKKKDKKSSSKSVAVRGKPVTVPVAAPAVEPPAVVAPPKKKRETRKKVIAAAVVDDQKIGDGEEEERDADEKDMDAEEVGDVVEDPGSLAKEETKRKSSKPAGKPETVAPTDVSMPGEPESDTEATERQTKPQQSTKTASTTATTTRRKPKKISDSDKSENSEDDDYGQDATTTKSAPNTKDKPEATADVTKLAKKPRASKKKQVDEEKEKESATVLKEIVGDDEDIVDEESGEMIKARAKTASNREVGAPAVKQRKEKSEKTKESRKKAVPVGNDSDVDTPPEVESVGKENKKEAAKKRKAAAAAADSVVESDNDDDAKLSGNFVEKKKRKLSAKPTVAHEADEMPNAQTSKSSTSTAAVVAPRLSLPKSPGKKPLFSWSKPALPILPGFQLASNPYSLGMNIDASIVSDFDRQRKKRMDMLKAAGQSQS